MELQAVRSKSIFCDFPDQNLWHATTINKEIMFILQIISHVDNLQKFDMSNIFSVMGYTKCLGNSSYEKISRTFPEFSKTPVVLQDFQGQKITNSRSFHDFTQCDQRRLLQTGGAKCQVKPTVEIKLDTTDVRFHFQRCDGMFNVCMPQFHCTTITITSSTCKCF